MSTIQELPAEVLVLVFKKLNSKDIQTCLNTCVRWKNIVSLYLFQPNLVHFAKHDAKLNEILCQSGWSDDSSDIDLIVFLHQKLKSSERWSKPSKVFGPLKIYFPFPNTKELSHSAIYENKVYLSFSDGSVQSRSLIDSFSLLQELHEPNSASHPSLNSFVPIYVFGNYLIVCFQPESNLLPIYLWNTKNDELVKKVSVQVLECDTFVKDCCFHVVDENFFLIFMATNSHIIKVRVSLTSEDDWMEQKLIAQPSLPSMEIDRFYLDLNEKFLVFMTGLVTPYNSRRQGLKRVSMLQCRSLQTEKTFWPNAEKVEKLEIESIKVSKHNVLALMCLDNSSTSQDSGFTYTVKLLSIPSGHFIQSIPNDQDSDMRMPLKWCDNQLFMKVTPKEKLDEDDEIHETLSIFDIDTQEEEVFTSAVNLRSYGRHILIDYTRIVEIHVHIPDQDGHPYDRHQLAGQLYEFWNT